VTHTNVEGFASMMAGMSASGLPGLKGDSGAALIGQINNSIMQGGSAGPAGQAFIYKALSAQGITDPNEVIYAMQGGMFEHVGNRGMTVYDAVRQQLDKEYPQGGWVQNMRRWNATSNLFGINMRQAQALDSFQPGDVDHAQGILGRYGMDLSQIDSSAIGEIAGVLGPNADLDAERKKLLGRTGANALLPEEKSALGNVEGDSLQYMLVRLLGSHGMEKTEGTKVQESVASLSNVLTAAGTGLIPVINDLRGATADLGKSVGLLSEWLEKKYGDVKNDLGDSGSLAPDGTDPETWDPLTGAGNFSAAQPPHVLSGDSAAPTTLAPDIEAEVRAQARAQGVDEDHMVRLALIERGGYDRVSPAGAMGPMQLMPDTAADERVDRRDWRQNVKGGVSYWKKMLLLFKGNTQAADAAYNAGPNNPGVAYFAATGDPSHLPAETQHYVHMSKDYPMTLKGPVAPSAPPPGSSRADKQFRIEPLTIIHKSESGETLATHALPVTTTASSPPTGSAPKQSEAWGQGNVQGNTQAIVSGMLRAHTAPRPKPVIAPDNGGA
jgi:hypothetical protein